MVSMSPTVDQKKKGVKTARWLFRFLAAWLLVTLCYSVIQSVARISPKDLLPANSSPQDFEKFSKKLSTQQIKELIIHEKLALANNPLDVQSLKNLTALSSIAGSSEDVKKLTIIMASRTLQDEAVLLASLNQSIAQKNYTAALRSLDALARSLSFTPEYAAAMSNIANTQKGLSELVEYFVDHPKWRPNLISFMANDPKQDSNILYAMFVAFKKAGAPPTIVETQALLGRLVTAKSYDQAYFIWLDQLSDNELRKVSGLFDGGFDFKFGNRFFDWTSYQLPNVQVTLVPRETTNGDNALVLDFSSGRTSFLNLSQYLRLTPGDYLLSGENKAENLENDRGLVWRIYCMPAGGPIIVMSEALMGTKPWTNFASKFNVPEQNCATQLLRLELNATAIADTQISGRVSYDNLKIERDDKPNAEP